MFTFTRIGPQWLRLNWPRHEALDTSVRKLISALEPIPGVKSFPGALELPSTVRALPDVHALIERCKVTWPTTAGLRYVQLEARADLYAHQLEGANLLLRSRVGLLTDQMGLGKTRTAAAAAQLVSQIHDGPVVIISTLASRGVWKRELQAIGALQNDADFCALLSRDLDDPSFNPHARWFFVHFDVVRAWWSKLHPLRPCCAILDEAHYTKNSRANRSIGAAMVLGPAPYRFLLTGTEMENKPSDLWNLLTLMTGAHTWGGPGAFRERYCGAVFNGFGLQDGQPTNVDELKLRMSPFYLRRTVNDVGISLPPLQRHVNVCDVDHKTKREQQLLLKRSATVRELVHAILTGSVRDDLLPLLTQLRQSASRAKLEHTIEYVKNTLEQGEHVVVFTWEKAIAQEIARVVKTPFCATGDTKQTDRDELIAAFQASTLAQAFIATYGSLREGVTLHRARFIVLHDLLVVLSHMLQAEARIHRIGQTRGAHAIWMVAEHTVDALIAPILEDKARALGVLVDRQAADALLDLKLAETVGVESIDAQVTRALETWGLAHG